VRSWRRARGWTVRRLGAGNAKSSLPKGCGWSGRGLPLAVCLAVVVSSCGGATVDTAGEPSSGGSAGRGNTGDVGGASGVGGTTSGQSSTWDNSGGSSVGCSTEVAPCVSSCFAALFSAVPGTCVDGYQHCPEGYVPRASCSEQSCAASRTECCNHNTGEYVWPDCDALGNAVPCPDGFQPMHNRQCAPDGVNVEQCAELDGTPCSNVSLQCHQGWTTCECGQRSPAVLAWTCVTILI
jgi:hypothetical protein